MKFKAHLILGFLFFYISVKLFNISLINSAIIFLSSILIDVDHYFWYVGATKDWNPFHAISWYKSWVPKWKSLNPQEKDKFKRKILTFHSLSFWILIYTLSFINPIFIFVFIGIMIHICEDYIHFIYNKEKFYPKFSWIYTFKRNKNKKNLTD